MFPNLRALAALGVLAVSSGPVGAAVMQTVLNLTDTTFGSGAITPNTLTATGGTVFKGGFIEGALFRDPSVEGSSGSGVFRDLYRLSPPNGPGNVTESGYNRVAMDSSIPNGFFPKIRVSDLVQDASESSYIFVVDVNESNNQERFISLDDFKVWVGESEDPSPLPGSLGELQTELGVPVYDMNPAESSNVVLLDATLSSGSGGGDLFIFVPKSKFGANPDPNAYVYLYTAMGGYADEPGFGAGATHEQVSLPGKAIIDGTEQGVIDAGVTVPEPGSAILLLLAAGGLLIHRRR